MPLYTYILLKCLTSFSQRVTSSAPGIVTKPGYFPLCYWEREPEQLAVLL